MEDQGIQKKIYKKRGDKEKMTGDGKKHRQKVDRWAVEQAYEQATGGWVVGRARGSSARSSLVKLQQLTKPQKP